MSVQIDLKGRTKVFLISWPITLHNNHQYDSHLKADVSTQPS